jgi:hypothetical protein
METKTLIDLNELVFVVAPEQPDEKEIIMGLAEVHHWVPPQVIKTCEMIYEPLIEEKWRYEPLEDYSTLPRGARDRLNLILKSCSPAGVVIGHEIVEKRDWSKIVKPLLIVVGAVVGVALLATLILTILSVLVGVLMVGAFLSCAGDPAVIIVTREGEWITIYQWYS